MVSGTALNRYVTASAERRGLILMSSACHLPCRIVWTACLFLACLFKVVVVMASDDLPAPTTLMVMTGST